MTPWQAMLELTEEQHLICMAWLDLDWERPDRGDFYAMQIACEVLRANPRFKGNSTMSVNDFKLHFGEEVDNRTEEEKAEEERQLVEWEKAAIQARVNASIKRYEAGELPPPKVPLPRPPQRQQ